MSILQRGREISGKEVTRTRFYITIRGEFHEVVQYPPDHQLINIPAGTTRARHILSRITDCVEIKVVFILLFLFALLFFFLSLVCQTITETGVFIFFF